ncbi:AAA family ATPase [Oculatella sp. LEGE 06141]|uniref:ATP-binding protein n=1 Tax=Oculatella sp. LEGE 06141 TaxID=1828648 RepID=UPI001880C8B3|nr:AAA family ATPase [Oculatella sp. LEGE 06141]MBE9180227.1 AAA family ATPase [Oculatella sp. LEGE 06141]
MNNELNTYIDAGHNVISLQTQLIERTRTIDELRDIARQRQLPCYLWNLGSGRLQLIESVADCQNDVTAIEQFQEVDPLQLLEFLGKDGNQAIFVLEDLHPFLETHSNEIHSRIATERLKSQIVNIVQYWRGKFTYLILLGCRGVDLPEALTYLVPEIRNPLPDYQSRRLAILQFLHLYRLHIDSELLSSLFLSSGGLTIEEIKQGLRLIEARTGCGLSGETLVKGMIDYKIDRLKAFNLSFTDRPSVSNFGGMDQIRTAIASVKQYYTPQAREMKIPLPKGWLLVGPPGTGKTFVSQFCASILNFPMISVDTGAIAAEGASYLRRLVDRIEAAQPAVVYFDELDKLFPDPGVPSDVTQRQVLGFLLTWLQSKKSETFVIATLNRLDSLPPELTRLGRFDEIFYVGFPNDGERKEILHLHLARFDSRYRNGGDPLSIKDWRIILSNTVNCTGAELSVLIEKAAGQQFCEGRNKFELGLEEILAARSEITPLYIRDTDRILRIENVAKHVAKPASSPDNSIFAPPVMTLWGQGLEPSSS